MEQDKVQIFNQLLGRIEFNKQKKEAGQVTSISPPFPRLAKRYPGWVKGKYTIITASSGVAKTKFSKFFAATSVYEFIKANLNIKVKVFYFALEETKEEFWLSMLSTILYIRYNIKISSTELLSFGEYTISDDILEKIRLVKDEIDDMESYIEVIDHAFNPYGIYRTVRKFFDNPEIGEFEEINTTKGKIKGKFKYKNEDQYVFVVTDQINLLVPDKNSDYGEPQMNLHGAMDYFSKEYCLKQMCKRLDCVVINIQQQSADKEKQEFHKGETIEKKLEPSLDGLGDNKLTQRDADTVFGIFAPTRYEIDSYRGYNINKLRDKYRCLIFLKDRNFGLANTYVHLYFDGAANFFKELPEASKMTNEIYDKISAIS